MTIAPLLIGAVLGDCELASRAPHPALLRRLRSRCLTKALVVT